MPLEKTLPALAGMIFIIFLSVPIARPLAASRWIIWNVGQGQWVTYSTPDFCWHFDMGGEQAPFRLIKKECGGKKNAVFLSHWDWDHVSFIGKALHLLPNLCLAQKPLTDPVKGRKRKFLELLLRHRCAVSRAIEIWKPLKAKELHLSTNDQSIVYLTHGFLTPGDSPAREERYYTLKMKGLSKVRVLILGHHGSRTATSETLLDSLPGLRLAIASARKRRFGHPHIQTVLRLRRHHIPLLTTEEWGNIEIEMP